MIAVAAYVEGTVAYAWCGWCRQWRWHGSAERLPEVRPSGCSKARNPACPTRDDAPVYVMPVRLARPLPTTGDGRIGGSLPERPEADDKHAPPIIAARTTMMPLPPKKPRARLAFVPLLELAASNGWTVRVETARGTWTTKTTARIADVCVARFDRDDEVLTMTFVDNEPHAGMARSCGIVTVTRIKALLKEKG